VPQVAALLRDTRLNEISGMALSARTPQFRRGRREHGLAGAGEEIIAAGRLDPAGEADHAAFDAAGHGGGAARRVAMDGEHHVAPDRRSAAGARDGAHRIPFQIADPHRDGEAIGKADAPIVAHRL